MFLQKKKKSIISHQIIFISINKQIFFADILEKILFQKTLYLSALKELKRKKMSTEKMKRKYENGIITMRKKGYQKKEKKNVQQKSQKKN